MCDLALEVKSLNIYYNSVKRDSIKRVLTRKGNKKGERIHAVRDVSFALKKGEILGVIGKNGSGKSTLLRAVAGVYTADSGIVDLKNNSVSLLSIGVGFRTELSGRDNVFLSGLLLGFSEKEINEKMKDIIEFSELGEFIDRPVRIYSSGMYSKLAFSIAVNLDTDIILIDEVLSVGDEKFSRKSYNRMKEIIDDKNKTVVIVSHSIPMLRELCNTIMWMHEGKIVKLGDAESVLKEYKAFMS